MKRNLQEGTSGAYDYAALSLPASRTLREAIFDFFLTGFVRNSRAKHLESQMAMRTAVSKDLWGPDQGRFDLACAIGEIVRDEIQWPNANFIPQDPMRLVLYQLDTVGLFFDNMEVESIIRNTENLVGRRLKRKEWERICEMTFGEAVDFLLQIKN